MDVRLHTPLAPPSFPPSTSSRRIRRILASGLMAGTISMLLLARRGQRDRGGQCGAVQALNAPSHWIFGDRALLQTAPSWRYTGWGTVIHQASSLMWATVFDRLVFNTRRQAAAEPPSVAQLAVQAVVTTGVAALVDLRLVPHRLTPGFQHHLSRRSLGWVYGSFGAGLLLGALLMREDP